MDGFVSAYSKTTGRKQRIPAHWVGHPVLGRNFEVAPKAAGRRFFIARNGDVHATDDPAGDPVGAPDETWTRDVLNTYARDVHSLDTSELRTKADVVAAVEEAAAAGSHVVDDDGEFVDTTFDADNQDSGDNPSLDETPATGEEEE